MRGSKSRPGRTVWSFLLLATVCLVSGTALAVCTPSVPLSTGDVLCYITVQPIDVCGTSGTSTCAPFNTTSTTGVGNPSTAGYNAAGVFSNTTSPNPIGFVVDPLTGASPPPAGDLSAQDITQVLLNGLGVNLVWLPMTTYNSPINPGTGTTFQTLNVTQTTSNGVAVFDSADFRNSRSRLLPTRSRRVRHQLLRGTENRRRSTCSLSTSSIRQPSKREAPFMALAGSATTGSPSPRMYLDIPVPGHRSLPARTRSRTNWAMISALTTRSLERAPITPGI